MLMDVARRKWLPGLLALLMLAVGLGAATTTRAEAASAPTPSPRVIAVTDSTVTIAWNSVPGSTGYRVGRNGTDTSGYGAWSTTDPASAASRRFLHLRKGTEYVFSVRALPNGTTQTVRATPGKGNPVNPAPTPFTVSVGRTTSSSVEITWTGVSGTTGYKVGRDGTDSSGYGAWSTTDPASARSRVFLGLIEGRTYTFTIAPQGVEVPARTIRVTAGTATTPPSTSPPPTTPPSMNRPSGMAFDSGVYADHSGSKSAGFASMRGRQLDVVTVFPTKDSWPAMQNIWWLDAVPPGYRGTLSVGVPMWPADGNANAAASGQYDAEWEKLGRSIASKHPDAYVRIGLEMNLNNHWAATPANKAQWIRAFQLASVNLKKGGPSLRVVWNPNEGNGQTGFLDAAEVWPGDQYVDVVGIDAYDWYPGYTNDANWAAHRDHRFGWNHWLGFARAHGKKFAVPEWGLYASNPNSGGDNPKYFDYVYGWMQANASHMAYEAYFDEPMSYCQCDITTRNPMGRASYRAWMGRLG